MLHTTKRQKEKKKREIDEGKRERENVQTSASQGQKIHWGGFILPIHNPHLYLWPPEDIKHLKTCLINQINCIDILTQPPTSAIADTIAFPLEKKPLVFI